MISSFRIPLLFVFLWSSAYIAFEFCSPHVEPATFVVVRTAITATILFLVVLFLKMGWPRRWVEYFFSSVVGILIHGVYAGGVFASVCLGIDIRLCALILSLQPIVTVLLSTLFLGEKITKRKFFGIPAGFLGVSIVILETKADTAYVVMQNRSDLSTDNGFLAILLCFFSLLAISIATVVQKRHCSATKLMSGACIQYIAAATFMLPFALKFETMQIDWNLNFIFGLGWLVVFVSIGAMSLLMILIKQGEAGSVANLLYLVTPLVAIEAWIVFGETVTPTSLGGMLLCIAGVLVVNYVSTAHHDKVAVYSSRKMIFSFVLQNIRVQVDQVQPSSHHRQRIFIPTAQSNPDRSQSGDWFDHNKSKQFGLFVKPRPTLWPSIEN